MEPAHLSLLDWTWEPTILVGLAAVVAAYVLAWRRGMISLGDEVAAWFGSSRVRAVLFGIGIAVGFVALASPLDTGGDEYLFSLHMVQHLLLMMVAPPLVILGLVGWRPSGAPAALRRVWGWLVHPWAATLIFSAVLLVWHIPALYDATLTTVPIHVAEHLSFVVVGVIFWWPIVDPQRGRAAAPVSPFMKIGMLVASGIPPTILGLLFTVGNHAFYDFYARAPRLWGLSAVADQQIAGVIMFGAGNLIYFAAVVIVFWRVFSDPAHDEDEAVRGGAG